jgi:anti-anti-sigma factor
LELPEVEKKIEEGLGMIAKTETSGGCKILSVGGRIDFESALEFENHVNAMLREPGDCYIIELSKVELLSSAGLRVMLSTAKRVDQRNAALGLAAPSQVVRQVFEISHFNLLFKIFDSVPEAIASLKGSSEPAAPREQPIISPVTEAKATQPAGPVEPPPQPAPPSEVAPPPVPPLRSSALASMAEAPTLAPPLFPAEASQEAASPPPKPQAPSPPPARVAEPPPLPTLSTAPTPPSPKAPGPVTRREVKYPARLEVRAEGTSYPCKDGDVIGTEGKLAQPFFSQVHNLAPRHLLIGQLDGRWFIFTPKNVQHPFTLDGVVLRPGERKTLQYVEHQIEFGGHVFGFRLVPEQPKEGLFSRIFGGKR